VTWEFPPVFGDQEITTMPTYFEHNAGSIEYQIVDGDPALEVEHIELCPHGIKGETCSDCWIAAWPKHCPKCMGGGQLEYTDNGAPFGSGLYWPMQIRDLCSCIEDGHCPRCGGTRLELKSSETHEWYTCLDCEWDERRPDICPPPAEFDGPEAEPEEPEYE
jgi:hypothetical protein